MALEDAAWDVVRGKRRVKVGVDTNAQPTRAQSTETDQKGRPGAKLSKAVKAQLKQVSNQAPQVLVKVTGRKVGYGSVLSHMQYIAGETRKADFTIEDREGFELDRKQDLQSIAKEWTDDERGHARSRTDAVGMVFAMPEGTDPQKVRSAARATVDAHIGLNHDYVLALHTDTPHPHVHVIVAAQGDNNTRFNPGPDELHRLRQSFAHELRSRGVEAEASSRMARNVREAAPSSPLHQMRKRVAANIDIARSGQAATVTIHAGSKPELARRSIRNAAFQLYGRNASIKTQLIRTKEGPQIALIVKPAKGRTVNATTLTKAIKDKGHKIAPFNAAQLVPNADNVMARDALAVAGGSKPRNQIARNQDDNWRAAKEVYGAVINELGQGAPDDQKLAERLNKFIQQRDSQKGRMDKLIEQAAIIESRRKDIQTPTR